MWSMLLRLVFLAACSPGVVSQVVLTQSGSIIKKPGESHKLTCATSGFALSGYWMDWFRQKPGKGLEWLVHYYSPASGQNFYSPAIQGRFSASKDSSNFYLQMSSLKEEDSAIYYCARYRSGPFYNWGQGTMVTVTSASPTAPTVFPLPPCCQDFSTASQVTLGCLVTGYFPEPVSVKWKEGASAISTGIRTFPAITHSSSGHYTLSSQLTVPASSWPSKTFQCNVDHPSTSSTISKQIEPCKTVAPKPTSVPVAPVVGLFHSSCTSGSSDAIIELVCHITGFYPSDVVVDWMEGEQTGVLSSYTEPPRKDENGNTFSTISTANISQSHWQDGNMVTCQVTHPATGTKERRTAKICEGSSSSSEVRVFILRPDPYDVFVEKRPKLTCVVINLESDIGLAFNWKWDKPVPLGASVISTKDELNGTITASSNLFVSEQDWMSGGTFTCTVQHSALPLPKSASISKKKEKATAPNVYLFRPHHEELISNGEYVSITALVKGFKPNEIALSWLHDNEPLPEANFVNSPVLRDGDNTYVMFSKLKVPKSEWNQGHSFSCMVVHEGLRMKFIQKNIEKPQVIIVSVDANQSDESGDEIESLWATILVFFTLFLLSVCYSASVTMFKVKWLFSMVVHLKKQPSGPEYKNVLHNGM